MQSASGRKVGKKEEAQISRSAPILLPARLASVNQKRGEIPTEEDGIIDVPMEFAAKASNSRRAIPS